MLLNRFQRCGGDEDCSRSFPMPLSMLALEEERMARMRENGVNEGSLRITPANGDMKSAEDEGIIRRELSKVDPSAVVFSESWAAKKVGLVRCGNKLTTVPRKFRPSWSTDVICM